MAALALLHCAPRAAGQGTAFTYQGGLNEGSAPANGSYDFVFSLYNDPAAGSQIGVGKTNLALPVSDGLFTTTLDFTGAPWNGQALWLQVLVRTNGSGAFSVLTPRQAFTSTPYAIQSLNATTAASASSVAATNLSGIIPVPTLPNIPLSGDVTGTQSATIVSTVGGQSATNIASGAIAANAASTTNAPGTIVLRDAFGNFSAGAISASSFSGDGSGLLFLNPTNLFPGTAAINISGSASNVTGNIADFQLSTNVALLSGSNLFSGIIAATNTNNLFSGTFSGILTGNALTANDFTDSLAGDVTGPQSATIVASVGGQPSSNIASGVIAANSATSSNAPGTIVLRDASGNFAAGAISAASLAGDGGALTNLNPASIVGGTAAINISGSASNVTGSIADSQLSTNVALLNGSICFQELSPRRTPAIFSREPFREVLTGNFLAVEDFSRIYLLRAT